MIQSRRISEQSSKFIKVSKYQQWLLDINYKIKNLIEHNYNEIRNNLEKMRFVLQLQVDELRCMKPGYNLAMMSTLMYV
jgi:hypothetical protein